MPLSLSASYLPFKSPVGVSVCLVLTETASAANQRIFRPGHRHQTLLRDQTDAADGRPTTATASNEAPPPPPPSPPPSVSVDRGSLVYDLSYLQKETEMRSILGGQPRFMTAVNMIFVDVGDFGKTLRESHLQHIYFSIRKTQLYRGLSH